MRRYLDYLITEEYSGKTAGAYLSSRGFSRRLINQLKRMPDGITADGAPIFATHRLEAGCTLRAVLPVQENPEKLIPVPMDLDLVYEDDDLIVVNKAAGVPIHPSQGHFTSTLANGLAWYYEQKGEPFVFRVINRLDRDTTGLLIVARHPLSACILSGMVKRHEIHRTYLAAVSGDLDGRCGVITAPIGRAPDSTVKRQVDFECGETACTHYRFLSYNPNTDTSLAELQLETGRTHQIRVHMQYLGFPLPGDFLYNPDYRYIGRQSLHSWKLDFVHPITKEPLSFTAAVPDDMTVFF